MRPRTSAPTPHHENVFRRRPACLTRPRLFRSSGPPRKPERLLTRPARGWGAVRPGTILGRTALLTPRPEKVVHPRRFRLPRPPLRAWAFRLTADLSEILYPKAAPSPRTEAPEPGPPPPDVASRSGDPTPATRKPSSLTPDPALPLR